jgi:hypothetical protein
MSGHEVKMDRKSHLTFDLVVRHSGNSYSSEVISDSGEPISEFALPFSGGEVDEFFGRISRAIRNPHVDFGEDVKNFGGQLFEAVFAGEVRSCLSACTNKARIAEVRLMIRLRLDAVPELASLPWEYLYNRYMQRFLALSEQTPIVRYLSLPEPPLAPLVPPPLNILVMISCPKGLPAINYENEAGAMRKALKALVDSQKIYLKFLSRGTPEALQDELLRGKYHIFHFIGHGGFDHASGRGVLFMEGEAGNAQAIAGDKLNVMLDHFHLRLAILNSCEGASSGGLVSLGGVAQNMVQRGLPAVIAMQFKIRDDSAVLFSRNFYSAMAEGYAVDACLANARKAIFVAGNSVEWGTPVLFMRSPDGVIFHIEKTIEQQRLEARRTALEKDAQIALTERDYETAIERLVALRDLRPTDSR